MHPLLEKLTIAIPVYNDTRYIHATISSCLPQAGRIVIYDNCSTDGTSEICADMAAKHPQVTHIRHPENLGAFENFKRGLFECATEYFCWIGSHDLLEDGYALKLLDAAEKDAAVGLVVGTIIQIDEAGKKTGRPTRSTWADTSKEWAPLERVAACVTGLRRDCSIFYGIYRTKIARDAWFDTPCLGFDRVILARTAAAGKIIYVPDAVFYARNLDKSRDKKTDRDRRSDVVSRDKPLPKNVFTRNKMMVETVLAQAKTYDELTFALKIIEKINRRYQNRRYYQKLRLVKIAAGILVTLLFVLALIY